VEVKEKEEEVEEGEEEERNGICDEWRM